MEMIIDKIEVGICEHQNVKSQTKKKWAFFAWDNISISCPLLKIVAQIYINTITLNWWINAKWTTSLWESVKLNFNGIVKGNIETSSARFVIHKDCGDLYWARLVKLLDGTNNDALFFAILASLKLCIKDKLCLVDIEGDSMIVILSVSSKKWID